MMTLYIQRTHRISEAGRPSSDHNIMSLVLKVQISMTCRVVPAHHNQFVCSCRSQRLSVLPCDCICVHMCMCVPVCACMCVCAHVIEKGIWAHLFSHAHLHNGQAPALDAEDVRGKLIEDRESERTSTLSIRPHQVSDSLACLVSRYLALW